MTDNVIDISVQLLHETTAETPCVISTGCAMHWKPFLTLTKPRFAIDNAACC